MREVIRVSKTVNDIMKDVCQLSLQDELERITKLNMNSIMYRSLSTEQINELAIKIELLPLEYRNILFFRYCFNNTSFETEKILETENSISKLRYVQKMLSSFMGLKDSWIDDRSMEKACQIALKENMRDYDNTLITYKPKYSKNVRRKLKDIKIKQSPNSIIMLVAKRVAIFILVCILSFSTVLAVNAEAREKVFKWIVGVFPKFSIFIPQDIDEDGSSIELTSIKINYIPKGFELADIHKGHNMLIYNYLADNNQKLTIKFFNSFGEGKSYYDTEDIEIDEVIIKKSQAYIWQTDQITYLIWYQDGIECHISGTLNQDEIFKIAEKISK